MNWSLLLLFFLLLVLFLKTPGIIRLRSARDAAAFYGIWVLTVMVTLADWADWPQLRPLDWVRSVMELLS
ncbi:hypothetical protein QW71_09430 [Paenibacillus sp. IHB B 3415]|uniref:hypothetical protein n=1 Tax=Paenibacillus sp. IHB B 3415 TaxID=867080 RepID=UPI0005755ED2|nr:hypothetical protein [Paenibacillus sp. IHB B 3415]KHL95983.1 hypothetical protein QW71_09430 [Paenibacillus sp. IHB B 3415]